VDAALARAWQVPAFAEFFTVRLLATLVTLRPDGTPHSVPVGVTVDPAAGTAWVITSGDSAKARNVAAAGAAGVPAAVTQVDGARWATLEGRAVVRTDPVTVAAAVERYARRYRQPRVNPRRVVIEVDVGRVLAGAALRRIEAGAE
jgi:PPOX class probable F420-dependent enzyme